MCPTNWAIKRCPPPIVDVVLMQLENALYSSQNAESIIILLL
jgi:hypothetical protein